MRTHEPRRRVLHGCYVEFVVNPPAQRRQERIRPGRIQDRIAVLAPTRRIPRAEVVVDDEDLVNNHLGCEERVERAPQAIRFYQGAGDVEVDELLTGVDPCIGAPRTRQADRLPVDALQLRSQLTCDRSNPYVLGESTEPAPVIGEAETDPGCCCGPGVQTGVVYRSGLGGQTSSIFAIGALSPWRGPSLRMRV